MPPKLGALQEKMHRITSCTSINLPGIEAIYLSIRGRQQTEKVKTIMINNHNQLIQSISSGNCILFVGAGFSWKATNKKLPLANELANAIMKELEVKTNKKIKDWTTNNIIFYSRHNIEKMTINHRNKSKDTNAEIVSGQYNLGQAAQCFIDGYTKYYLQEQNYMNNEAIYDDKNNISQIRIEARKELLKIVQKMVNKKPTIDQLKKLNEGISLPWASIYTTNYDLFIEYALDQAKIKYRTVTRSADMAATRNDALEIIKIHGSIDEIHLDDNQPLILTEDDYAGFKASRKLLIDQLKTNLAQRDCLFLGYGLADNNLDLIFREVHDVMVNSKRTMWVQTHLKESSPRLESLQQRGFKIIENEDPIDFLTNLADDIRNFRSLHDDGYLDFCIINRDNRNEDKKLNELVEIKMQIASEITKMANDKTAISFSGSGDELLKLYHFLKAKRPLVDSNNFDDLTKNSIANWLSNANFIKQLHLQSESNYHCFLELSVCMAPYLEPRSTDAISKVYKKARKTFKSTLSRWLELHAIRRICSDTNTAEGLRGILITHLKSLKNDWLTTKLDDGIYEELIRIIPALMHTLAEADPKEPIAPKEEKYALAVWEFSKWSGEKIGSQGSNEYIELHDKVNISSDYIQKQKDLFDPAKQNEKIPPLSRRATIRYHLDVMLEKSCSDQDVLNFIKFERNFLEIFDMSSSVPLFASFVVLEQVHEAKIRKLDLFFEKSLEIFYDLLEISFSNIDSDKESSKDEIYYLHFVTASVRPFLNYAKPTQETKKNRLVNILEKMMDLSKKDSWLMENLLNVIAHQITYGSFNKRFGADGINAVRKYIFEPLEEDIDNLNLPLLRYYSNRAETKLRGYNVR